MVSVDERMPREHGEDGEFIVTVTLDDVRQVFDRVRGPVVFSADVADQLGCSRETGRRKLEALYDRGEVDRRKISRRVVYWLREDAHSNPPETSDVGRETAERRALDRPGETAADTRADSRPASEAGDSLAAAVRAYLADRPPRTEHGTAVILDVFRLLRDRGTMKTGELKQELYPHYDDHYASERAMWESVSRYLGDVPGIEKGGYGEWAYTSDDTVRAALG